MGRRKGSLNKKKEASTEEADAPKILTDQERWALTAAHVQAFEASTEAVRLAAEAKRDADADLKFVVKRAEQEGIPLADMKAWQEAQSAEGQSRMKEIAERLARTSRWFGFKLGTQAEMFDESPAPVTNRSHRLGYEAGLAGDPPKAPTDCDVNAWLAAWQKGQVVKLGGLKKLESAA